MRGLRSRLVYMKPDQATYDRLVDEADLNLREIRDEATILVREALDARARRRGKRNAQA